MDRVREILVGVCRGCVCLGEWIFCQVRSVNNGDLYAIKVGSVAGFLLFTYFLGYMHTVSQIWYNNEKLCLICAYLFCIFCFFSFPFFGKTIEPSYLMFSRCYMAWIVVVIVYHLPICQSMGPDVRMYLSLFFTNYISSILCVFVFHISIYGLRYIGLVARVAGKKVEIWTTIWTIIIYSPVVAVISCLNYRSCAIIKEKSLERPLSDWISTKWDQICSSDGISIYSSWSIIGLLVVEWCIRVLTRPTVVSAEEYDRQQMKPDFQDMVPWYSGTSTDLYKTFFNLLVSVNLFLGRFDMRMMQAAMIQNQDRTHHDQDGTHTGDFFYDQFSDKEELWFDFMADTGDGGSSSYSVAKLLAQPSINARENQDPVRELPRGDLLLIGGDLAYPNPTPDAYEKRFFYPFQEALQPPSSYKSEHITVNKKQYDGPQCFIIPGNHDWFDGLHTFMRYICQKSWLGGWFLPQKKSYFALKLPQGWWLFGFDQALHDDIDAIQFKFFAEFIENKVDKNDSVIIMTHEPNWLFDWYLNKETGKNVSHLIKDHLKGRCKLRMAGDLHHYMHHSCVQSENPPYVPHLLVNGGGGAFLHPTHVFSNFNESNGTSYKKEAAYPSFEESSKIARGNINFRTKNWQFDFIGGIIYFILVSSLFPQCKLDHILQNDSFSGYLKSFFGGVWHALIYVFEQSYTSLAVFLLLLTAALLLVPSKVSFKGRAFIGFLHVSAHMVSALIVMLLLELVIEIFFRHGLLATSGYHTLYEWYRSEESKHFPDPTGLRTRIERWTFGLYPACFKHLMSTFDIPEVMAVTRNNICKHGIQSLSRWSVIIYYACVFIYFWVLSTPMVSMVFGIYLYLCIDWLHIHFDEAFSSLRIADYKSFTRFHITDAGDLEVFTLGVDKVPQDWKLDPNWDAESKQTPSRPRQYPSKWTASIPQHDPLATVRIVDHFTLKKNNNQANEEGNTELHSTNSQEEIICPEESLDAVHAEQEITGNQRDLQIENNNGRHDKQADLIAMKSHDASLSQVTASGHTSAQVLVESHKAATLEVLPTPLEAAPKKKKPIPPLAMVTRSKSQEHKSTSKSGYR